jgi:AcrR family transcriptional regulator
MEEKVQHIIEKVSALYLSYGIRSVTMDDVARELGVSKKTLYECVADKNDLVEKFLDFHAKRLGAALMCIYNGKMNAIDALLEISRIINHFLKDINPSITFDLQKYHPEIWKKLMKYKSLHVYDNVMTNLRQGIKEGLYRSDMKPEVIAKIYVSRVELSMEPGLTDALNYSSSEIFNELINYHIRGIASKKGIEYLDKKIATQQKKH